MSFTHDRESRSWIVTGDEITDLMHRAIRGHISHPEPDAVLNIETHLFNVILVADSCAFDLDIGREVWLNKGRWSRLMREYVPKEGLDRLTNQACEILLRDARDGATANMMFHDPDRYAKKHRWGGCLMGATFRGNNAKAGKPELSFYSRTTYIGYMGLLDAGIATCIAYEILNKMRKKSSEWAQYDGLEDCPIGFRWYISSMQLHCFKTLPFVFSQADLYKKLDHFEQNRELNAKGKVSPTWYHMNKWYWKIVDAFKKYGTDMLDHEKYGPFKRIKRRWLEHQGHLKKNVPPSLKLHQVDFSKCV